MRRLIVGFLLALLILTACGGDEETPAPPALSPTPIPPSVTPRPTSTPVVMPETDTDPRTRAQLRVVHASPDLPAIDLYLDGANIGSRFTLGLYHNNPLAFSAGDYTLRILPAGSDPGEAAPLLDYPLTLAENQSLIAVLTGTVDALQVTLFNENIEPLPADTARVSVIHAVPNGPAFDLQDSGQELLPALAFGKVEGPTDVAAGDHSLQFMSASTELASLDTNLLERFVYTFLLVGNAGGGNYRVVQIRSRATSNTQVRVIHTSPDTPTVDIYFNDELVADDLEYREWQDWTPYPSLAYDVRIVEADGGDPIYEDQIALPPDESVNIFLLDAVERLRVVQIKEDVTKIPEGGTRLTFVNTAIGTTELSVETPGGPLPGVDPVFFGTASLPFIRSAGPEKYYFPTTEAEPRLIDTIETRDWATGTAYTIVLTGYPNTEPLVLETEVGVDASLTVDDVLEPDTSSFDTTANTHAVRVVNALSGSGPIDVEISGAVSWTAIAPGTGTAYQTVEDEQVALVIRNAGAEDTLLAQDMYWGDARQLTLFVFSSDEDIRAQAMTDSILEIPRGKTRLRLFHGVPDQPRLAVVPTTPPPGEGTPSFAPIPLTDAVDYGQASDPADIQPGTFDLTVLDYDNNLTVATMQGVTLEERAFYDLVLVPDSSGGVNPVLISHGSP